MAALCLQAHLTHSYVFIHLILCSEGPCDLIQFDCNTFSLQLPSAVFDDSTEDNKKQFRHLILPKMPFFITLFAVLLCRRSPYTLDTLVCGCAGCCIPGSSGKRRPAEKWRGGCGARAVIDLPFIRFHIA